MALTLKERYKAQRVETIREHVKKLDNQLIIEQRAAMLLVEAMNDEDLSKVTAIVQKLNSIKSPELPNLTAAIEQAESELNKYTAGGPLTAAWTKMKKLVGLDNPIVKVTTFANALEKGFSQIPQILKNNGVDLKNVDLNQSLTKYLASKSSGTGKQPETGKKNDDELGNTKFSDKQKTFKDDPVGSEWPGPSEGVQNEADGASGNVDSKIKNIISQLQKALSPSGLFGAFKKVPYISSEALAQELVNAPLNVFSKVAKKINAGTKTTEIVPDLKAQMTAHGETQTSKTNKEEPTKPVQQQQPSITPKDATVTSDTTGTGETPDQPRGGGSQPKNYKKAKAKIIRMLNQLKNDPHEIDNLVKKFVDAGLDSDRL